MMGPDAMENSMRVPPQNENELPYDPQHIMQNAGLEEAQAGIKTARRNINNLRYADDTTLTAESEEE